MDTAKEILAMIKDMFEYVLNMIKEIFGKADAEGDAEVK